jgi:hemerythrin-like domain-containing protein
VCEYCGCQSLASIDLLTREHDAAVALIAATRAAATVGDAGAAATLARKLAALLEPHTVVEESGLFPAMAGDFPDHVAGLTAEHRAVEAVLGEAAAGVPAEPAWLDRLLAALEVLRAHILKEQDGLFPAALTSLGPVEWERVDEVRGRVGTRLETAEGAARDQSVR